MKKNRNFWSWVARSPKSLIWPGKTALLWAQVVQQKKARLLLQITFFFSLCPFRMRFALFLFFIGRFGWTSPFFPNKNTKGCLTSRCRLVFRPQWDGEFVTSSLYGPSSFWSPARVVPTTGGEHLSIRSCAVTGSPITPKANFNSPKQGSSRVVIVDLYKDIEFRLMYQTLPYLS